MVIGTTKKYHIIGTTKQGYRRRMYYLVVG